jgi:hypothetical protein
LSPGVYRCPFKPRSSLLNAVYSSPKNMVEGYVLTYLEVISEGLGAFIDLWRVLDGYDSGLVSEESQIVGTCCLQLYDRNCSSLNPFSQPRDPHLSLNAKHLRRITRTFSSSANSNIPASFRAMRSIFFHRYSQSIVSG